MLELYSKEVVFTVPIIEIMEKRISRPPLILKMILLNLLPLVQHVHQQIVQAANESSLDLDKE